MAIFIYFLEIDFVLIDADDERVGVASGEDDIMAVCGRVGPADLLYQRTRCMARG